MCVFPILLALLNALHGGERCDEKDASVQVMRQDRLDFLRGRELLCHKKMLTAWQRVHREVFVPDGNLRMKAYPLSEVIDRAHKVFPKAVQAIGEDMYTLFLTERFGYSLEDFLAGAAQPLVVALLDYAKGRYDLLTNDTWEEDWLSENKELPLLPKESSQKRPEVSARFLKQATVCALTNDTLTECEGRALKKFLLQGASGVSEAKVEDVVCYYQGWYSDVFIRYYLWMLAFL